MREAFINYRAKRIVSKYKTYADFSVRATPAEKKTVFESTITSANKLQRRSAGAKS
jgi:hypothetical protein